jgi:predicted phage-related endonuclease
LCWLFVLIGSSDFRRYRIVRDETYFPMALPILTDFWGHVLRREPPPVDYSSEDARKALSRMNKPTEGESVELSTGVENEVLEYERLGKLITELQESRDIAKAKIIEEMKSANVGILPGRTVTRKLVTRKAYEVKESTCTDFRVKLIKGTK